MLANNPDLVAAGTDGIESMNIVAYEPAYGIIGDPAKKDPKTRQSADHSMAFIVSRMLKKALEMGKMPADTVEVWRQLMLTPHDYGHSALFDEATRALMQKISFSHGGEEYDSKYPDGIPTSMDIKSKSGKTYSSGMVMYPPGHARNTTADLDRLLERKNAMLGELTFKDQHTSGAFVSKLQNLKDASPADVLGIYSYDIAAVVAHPPIDGPRPVGTASKL